MSTRPASAPEIEALTHHADTVVQVSASFGEALDLAAFAKAWGLLARRYPILASTFSRDADGRWTCLSGEPAAADWPLLDWSAFPPAEVGDKWRDLLAADAGNPLDPTVAPPVRIQPIVLPGGSTHLLWSLHPALLDDQSIFVALRDWLTFYGSSVEGVEPAGGPPPQDQLSKQRNAAFWKTYLTGAHSPVSEKNRPRKTSAHDGQSLRTLLDRQETASLQTAARSASATLPDLALAAWGLLASRQANSPSALILASTSLREPGDLFSDSAVGLLDHLLPALVEPTEDAGIDAWIGGIASTSRARAKHSAIACSDALAAAGLPADSPFATAFAFSAGDLNHRIHGALPRWLGLDARIYRPLPAPMQLRLSGNDRLAVDLDFDPHQIRQPVAAHLHSTFLALLRSLATLDGKVGAISPTSPEEHEHLLARSRGPSRGTRPLGLLETLRTSLEKHSERTAIEMADEALSFGELDTYSSQVAGHLLSLGFKPHSIIAVCMTRTPWLPVALLGILRSGFTILPLDPDLPPALAESLLDRLEPAAVLSDSASAGNLSGAKRPHLVIDKEWERIIATENPGLPESLPRDSTACLLSAPQPSESNLLIRVSADALAQAAANVTRAIALDEDSRLLAFGLPGRLLEELCAAIIAGGRLVLLPQDIPDWRDSFTRQLASSEITHVVISEAQWINWSHHLSKIPDPSGSFPESLRVVAIEMGRPGTRARLTWDKHVPAGLQTLWFYSPFRLLGASLVGGISAGGTSPDLQPVAGATHGVLDRSHRLQGRGAKGSLYFSFRGIDISRKESPGVTLLKDPIFPGSKQPLLDCAVPARRDLHYLIEIDLAGNSPHPTWEKLRGTLLAGEAFFDAIVGQAGEEETLVAWVLRTDSGDAPTTGGAEIVVPIEALPINGAGDLDLASLPVPQITRPDAPVSGDPVEATLQRAAKAFAGRVLAVDFPLRELARNSTSRQKFREAALRARLAVPEADLLAQTDIRSIARGLSERFETLPIVSPLRDSGDHSPLYLAAGAEADPNIYTSLAADLGPDQPVYGIALRPTGAEPAAIPALAAACAKALAAERTTGTFRLAGYDLGAILAWETAVALEQLGRKVAFLALIEPPALGRPPAGNSWRSSLPGFLRSFAGGDSDSAVGSRPSARVPRPLRYRNEAEITRTLRAAQEIYRHGKKAKCVPHFIFTPNQPRAVEDWIEVAPDAEVHRLDAGNSSPLEEPAADRLAALLRQLLTPAR